jgi:C-terminal processing protease CtpA/Prc
MYVRAGQVSLGFGPQLAAILEESKRSTNTLGLILDLRFAGGGAYEGAANAADLFASAAGPLLDWGTGQVSSTAKTNAWSKPVVVLVNRETGGAAEALAGALRAQRAALVIGSRTAGTAAVFRDIPLADGRRIRMAVAAVKTGDGESLPSDGMLPDIQVTIATELERAYLSDPFTPILTSTNVASGSNRLVSTIKVHRKITEADLVRARKAGEPDPDTDAPSTMPATTPGTVQTVRDPALARAIDLLKGLRVIRQDSKP